MDKIVSLRDSLITKLQESDNIVSQFFGNVLDKVAGLQDAMIAKFNAFLDWAADIRQLIVDKVQEVIDWSSGNWKSLFDWAADIRQFFLDKFLDLFEKLTLIRETLLDIPGLVFDKMKELFEMFFIPDEEAINAKFEAVREKFAFIESVSGYGEHLVGFLQSASGSKAPVITIDLSAYSGKYSYGTSTITMDFSWYAKYKPTVDNLVAGIIYATWLWHLYKRIPELIHGQGMTAAHVIDLSGKE